MSALENWFSINIAFNVKTDPAVVKKGERRNQGESDYQNREYGTRFCMIAIESFDCISY
jgi:hypothetical protein